MVTKIYTRELIPEIKQKNIPLKLIKAVFCRRKFNYLKIDFDCEHDECPYEYLTAEHIDILSEMKKGVNISWQN